MAEEFSECDGVEGRCLEAVGPFEAVERMLCEAVGMASVEDLLVDAVGDVDAVAEVDADRSRLCDTVSEGECDAEEELVRVKNGLGIPSVSKA